MFPVGVFDDDGLLELLRWRAYIIFPGDLAGFGLEGDNEAAPCAAGIGWVLWIGVLMAAAPDDDFPIGEDGRGHKDIGVVATGKAVDLGVERPELLAAGAIERVEHASRIAEENRAVRYQGGAQDAGPRADPVDASFSFFAERALVGVGGNPKFPCDGAVGLELVEGRLDHRAEVDMSVHHDGCGVDGADELFRPPGGKAPLLLELTGIVGGESFFRGVVAPAEHIEVVHRPVTGRDRRQLIGPCEGGSQNQQSNHGQRKCAHEMLVIPCSLRGNKADPSRR